MTGMENVNGTTRIEIKLLASGRYTWTIASEFPTPQGTNHIETIKEFDRLLRDEFPDYAKRGSGRVASMDE